MAKKEEQKAMVKQDWGDEFHYGVDEAYYELGHTDRMVDDDDFRTRVALALTIPPRPVADWIIENCLMILVRSACCHAPQWTQGRYLALFEANTIFNDLPDQVAHLILHESAHAYLGHGTDSIRSPTKEKQEETEADRLVAQWMRGVRYNKRWIKKRLSKGRRP